LDSTYHPIIQYIAKPSLENDIIKYNTEIVSVIVRHSGIQLTSSDNRTFTADSLIITVPLGLLQQHGIKFSPPLPSEVHSAISDLGFGLLEKIFIRFSSAWWLLASDPVEIGLQFYRFPSYLSTTHTLPTGALNFVSFAQVHNPQPVFGVFVATTLAQYLCSLPSKELQKILQESYVPHLPNYSPFNPECEILSMTRTTWSQDRFAGYGSYTHIPCGSTSGDQSVRVLAQKVWPTGSGVWFAGEHTADTEVVAGELYSTMATVTGAYKSGERVGLNVIREYFAERDE
jgi:Flavin containing amine oxidoreductase